MNSSNDKISLDNRPDLAAKLEKYGLLPAEPVITRNELRELIKRVDEKIEDKKKGDLNLPNPGNEAMLSDLVDVALLAIMSAATYAAENGLGILPEKEEMESKWAKNFSFEALLRLIIGTDVLTAFFQEVAKISTTTEKNRKTVTEALKLTALLFAIYAASKGEEERLKKLIEEASKPILEGIKNVEPIVEDKRLSLYMRQGALALEKEEYDQFLKACYGALEVLEITPEKLKKDFKEISHLSNIFAEAFAASDEEATTALTHAM